MQSRFHVNQSFFLISMILLGFITHWVLRLTKHKEVRPKTQQAGWCYLNERQSAVNFLIMCNVHTPPGRHCILHNRPCTRCMIFLSIHFDSRCARFYFHPLLQTTLSKESSHQDDSLNRCKFERARKRKPTPVSRGQLRWISLSSGQHMIGE